MRYTTILCFPLRFAVGLMLLSLASCGSFIQTVNGKINGKVIRGVLPHEHIVTNFSGANKILENPTETTAAIRRIMPHLDSLKAQGVNTLFECTPRYIGRDVALLKLLSDKAGINIITNTGWYAAVDKKYLPAEAFRWSEDEIAQHWMNEFLKGIGDTGIKPGFIKLGVGDGRLDTIEAKLLRAAIQVSHSTGLTIAVHTGDGIAAKDELAIAIEKGLKPGKLIWVHAQNGTDAEREELAKQGVWISLDGISETTIQNYLKQITYLKRNKLTSRLLISHDDGWSVLTNGTYGELELFKNGNSSPYQTINKRLIPLLLADGFTHKEINRIMHKNPAKALSLSR